MREGFVTIISGVFAYPLTEEWLGKEIDRGMVDKLVELQEKFKMNPAGEGGEIETTVLDAPFFRKRVKVVESGTENRGEYAAVFVIKKAELENK